MDAWREVVHTVMTAKRNEYALHGAVDLSPCPRVRCSSGVTTVEWMWFCLGWM